MVINSQRTIYGLALQMAKLLNREYKIRNNTTLNEKFDINTNISLEEGMYPSINYYAIGVGGTGYVDEVDTYNFSKHKPTDAALFEHIPFVMRTLDNDLVLSERVKYRFRKVILVNGIEYAAYYLKVIDDDYTVDDIYLVDVADKVSKLSKFNSNSSDLLNPIPRDTTLNLTESLESTYITAATKLKFSLSTSELVDITETLQLLYGDNTKTITEVAVCSGIDVDVNGVDNALAVNVQIIYHFEVELLPQLDLANGKEIHRSLEIGGTEPLIM